MQYVLREGKMTISLRLDDDLTRRLATVAKAKGISKSELIRQCLHEYLASTEQQPTAWELGRHLFGCFDSGKGDLSERAKEVAREQIRAKCVKTSGR
jgi:metal-responsive CopG/Arc/MetJ family transcriptional regulator